jgi:hypothetical protein
LLWLLWLWLLLFGLLGLLQLLLLMFLRPWLLLRLCSYTLSPFLLRH